MLVHVVTKLFNFLRHKVRTNRLMSATLYLNIRGTIVARIGTYPFQSYAI